MADNNIAIIGIDMGGTKVAAGILDSDGKILMELREPTALSDIDEIESQLARICRSLLKSGEEEGYRVAGIGVAVPGAIDVEAGVFIRGINLPWTDFPIKAFLEGEFGIRTEIENDANAGALGEKYYGAGKGLTDFIYISIGTGIGSGIVSGNRLVRGVSNRAGEVGHMIVDPGGPRCKCGAIGCLESVASGSAIQRRVREAVDGGAPGYLARMAGSSSEISTEDVIQAARAGDDIALTVLRDAGRYLGLCCINLFKLLAPQAIIIGGGVSNAGEILINAIKEGAVSLGHPLAPHERILISPLGDRTGIVGAGAVLCERSGLGFPCLEERGLIEKSNSIL